jgi:hypothetical protein
LAKSFRSKYFANCPSSFIIVDDDERKPTMASANLPNKEK